MNPRNLYANASATAPTAPSSPSTGYFTNGNPGTGQQASIPGAFWFHQIGEELRNVILAAGLTPSVGSTSQIASALAALYAITSGSNSSGHWIKLPDSAGGYILQFGGGVVDHTGKVEITWPLEFPTECLWAGGGTHIGTGGATVIIDRSGSPPPPLPGTTSGHFAVTTSPLGVGGSYGPGVGNSWSFNWLAVGR